MRNSDLIALLILMAASWSLGSDPHDSALNVLFCFGGFMVGVVIRTYLIHRLKEKKSE